MSGGTRSCQRWEQRRRQSLKADGALDADFDAELWPPGEEGEVATGGDTCTSGEETLAPVRSAINENPARGSDLPDGSFQDRNGLVRIVALNDQGGHEPDRMRWEGVQQKAELQAGDSDW